MEPSKVSNCTTCTMYEEHYDRGVQIMVVHT